MSAEMLEELAGKVIPYSILERSRFGQRLQLRGWGNRERCDRAGRTCNRSCPWVPLGSLGLIGN